MRACVAHLCCTFVPFVEAHFSSRFGVQRAMKFAARVCIGDLARIFLSATLSLQLSSLLLCAAQDQCVYLVRAACAFVIVSVNLAPACCLKFTALTFVCVTCLNIYSTLVCLSDVCV
jgi:hypothetical protein